MGHGLAYSGDEIGVETIQTEGTLKLLVGGFASSFAVHRESLPELLALNCYEWSSTNSQYGNHRDLQPGQP